MFRFGIVRQDRLPKALDPSLPRPAIALTILAHFNAHYRDEDEPALALIYSSAPADTAGGKRTFPQRYRVIDEVLVEEIERLFEPDRRLRIHEMAASNAITSLELFERLKHREGLSFLASDYFDVLYVVRPPRSRWQAIFNADHRCLQLVGCGMVVPAARPERKRYVINRIVRRLLLRTVVPRALRILKQAGSADDSRVQRISLFHPRCLMTARNDSRFSLGRDSVFEPRSGTFDVIRIMGVERRFPPEKIAHMYRAIAPHIADGGLLVAGYNRDYNDLSRVPTTIYQRCGTRFRAVRDITGEHEHKRLVLSLDIGPP